MRSDIIKWWFHHLSVEIIIGAFVTLTELQQCVRSNGTAGLSGCMTLPGGRLVLLLHGFTDK